MGKLRLITIAGPTASGKTRLAIDRARELGTEIISADSRQVYRDIPIGTAAPTPDELALAHHHLVGTLGLHDYFSAAEFARLAIGLAADIESRCGGVAVVCGGSVMYVKALLGMLDDIPTISPEVRTEVADMLAGPDGLARLRLRLLGLDPEYYRRVDLSNPRRVAHAVEVCLQAGVPYSRLLTGRRRELPFEVEGYIVDRPRAELFARIDARVDAMMASGLLEEARAALAPYISASSPAQGPTGAPALPNSLNTVGYKELLAHFRGEMSLPQAVERIKKNTRVYAKKQLTQLAQLASLPFFTRIAP